MKGGDLDTYIAEFDRLVGEVGYNKDDWGTIVKFKEGLHQALLGQILDHVLPAPNTIEAWKKAGRERQTVYREKQNAGLIKGGPTPSQKRWAGLLGLNNYHTPLQRTAQNPPQRTRQNQVVPMDVDATKYTPLTDQERAQLSKTGACFYCRKQGHISRNCPNKRTPGKKTTTIRTTETSDGEKNPEEPAGRKMDMKELAKWIREQPAEEKEALVDELQDF